MAKYEFEKQLDRLLNYFVGVGCDHALTLDQLPEEFRTQQLPVMLDLLKGGGFIKNLSTEFEKGKPVEFPQLWELTTSGLWFYWQHSFVGLAKQRAREERRWSFEFMKLGVDSAIALLSLGVSFSALFYTIFKG